MQFKVPQFLEIEDKIFGPFTFRQFAYLAGGAGICFIIYKALGFLWGSIPILLVAGFAGALTFYRPNNKPFIYMIEAGFKYLTQNKLYIWKKHMHSSKNIGANTNLAEDKTGLEALGPASRISGNKLRDLAWSLDVLDISKKDQIKN